MTAPRFSLREAAADPVATARSDLAAFTQGDPEAAPSAPAPTRRARAAKPETKTARPKTRENARAATAWLEPEMYRMIKLICLERDLTVQDAMVAALDDWIAKNGKGRLARRGGQ